MAPTDNKNRNESHNESSPVSRLLNHLFSVLWNDNDAESLADTKELVGDCSLSNSSGYETDTEFSDSDDTSDFEIDCEAGDVGTAASISDLKVTLQRSPEILNGEDAIAMVLTCQ